MLKRLTKIPLEAFMWIVGLSILFFLDPSQEHLSVCPFHQLGFEFCPGCGLGRSISHLFAGEFSHSFHAHPLGFFALIVILSRIVQLIKNNFHSYGTNY